MKNSFEQAIENERIKELKENQRMAAHKEYQNFFKTHVCLNDGWHVMGYNGKKVQAPIRPR